MTKYDYLLTSEPEYIDSGTGYYRVEAEDCDGDEVTLHIWQCDEDIEEGDIIRSDGERDMHGYKSIRFGGVVEEEEPEW